LLLAVKKLVKFESAIADVSSGLLDVRTRAYGAEAECATYKREMAALHLHITELQKEKAQLLKRLEQADAHIKKVDGSVSRLSASHGRAEAELKAALSKLASEQTRVKACIDAMVDSKR